MLGVSGLLNAKQVAEDKSSVNMLIYLLLRHPQIFFINYNLAKSLFCISFMLTMKLDRERYINFRKNFSESMVAYKDMAGVSHSTRIKCKNVSGRTLLQVNWKNDTISIEEVNLVSSLVLIEFHKELIFETRKESYIQKIYNLNEDEVIEYLPHRKKENEDENLFAFREAGRVYVFDK